MSLCLTVACKFDAAHKLPGYDGPCANLHGHTWKVKFTFQGEANPETGTICDFKDLKRICHQVLAGFDHTYLNLGIDNPTAENLVVVIFDRVSILLDPNIHLYQVELWENDDCSAIYRPRSLVCE